MDHFAQTIEAIRQSIAEAERELADQKRLANSLAKMAGLPPIYTVVEQQSQVPGNIKGDEYFGKAATTAIREVLETRKACDLGPATVNEIYDALIAGGYEFDTSTEANAKNSLRVTLSKRTETFVKLPNGKFSLLKYYDAKAVKRMKSKNDDEAKGRETMEREFGPKQIELELPNEESALEI